MIIIMDNLVFIPESMGSAGWQVRLQCAAENNKMVGYAMRRSGQMNDRDVAKVIDELMEWFELHTRPDMTKLKDFTSKDRFKKPYRPAGYLRRLTDEELAPYAAKQTA